MASRVAVVSPFVDKSHGTERRVVEDLEQLARAFGYEIHVYSGHVEDVTLGGSLGPAGGSIAWHRVLVPPGPHVVAYLWWFVANHLRRWRDGRRGLRFDLVYSPGINCFDADVVSVHIVFAELYRQVREDLRLRRNRLRVWPRVAHRLVYYRLVMALERRIYPGEGPLLTVSRKVGEDLARHYGRESNALHLIYHGIDRDRFNPAERALRRPRARAEAGLPFDAFALLLVGNDWRNKGMGCLLQAVIELVRSGDPVSQKLRVLVVGRDDPAPFEGFLRRLDGRVRFLPSRPDVEAWYAAADAYVGPSLVDAFGLPPAEAMACGLPVIVSSEAGVSETVTDGVDGLILKDPRNASELAGLIRRLLEDRRLCRRLGERAARAAAHYTWEESAARMNRIFQDVIASKR